MTGETRLERQAKRDRNGEPWEGLTKEGVSRRDGAAEREKKGAVSCRPISLTSTAKIFFFEELQDRLIQFETSNFTETEKQAAKPSHYAHTGPALIRGHMENRRKKNRSLS